MGQWTRSSNLLLSQMAGQMYRSTVLLVPFCSKQYNLNICKTFCSKQYNLNIGQHNIWQILDTILSQMAGQTYHCTVLLAPMDHSLGTSKTWMDGKYTSSLLQQPAPPTYPLLPRPTVPQRRVGITCWQGTWQQCLTRMVEAQDAWSCPVGASNHRLRLCGLDDLLDDLCLHGTIIVGLFVRRGSFPLFPCLELPEMSITIY